MSFWLTLCTKLCTARQLFQKKKKRRILKKVFIRTRKQSDRQGKGLQSGEKQRSSALLSSQLILTFRRQQHSAFTQSGSRLSLLMSPKALVKSLLTYFFLLRLTIKFLLISISWNMDFFGLCSARMYFAARCIPAWVKIFLHSKQDPAIKNRRTNSGRDQNQ